MGGVPGEKGTEAGDDPEEPDEPAGEPWPEAPELELPAFAPGPLFATWIWTAGW